MDAEPGQPSSAVRAIVVFAGYGIEAPDLGVDDYSGLDVEGKIVFTLVGAPDSLPTDAKAHLSREDTKARTAAAHGAVGMLRAYPPGSGRGDLFLRAAGRAEIGSMTWKAADGRGHDVTSGLLAGALVSRQVADLLAEGDEVSLSQASIYSGFESPNVVALVPGRAPELAHEHVVITAHLDHVGVGRPDASGDAIYNGAGDNASGAAVLLEVARLLATSPPRRSVIFVAVTAEERGLVGSDYFIHNPPVAVDDIVANINLDSGVFLYDFTDIIPFGTAYSSLDENVRRVAASLGSMWAPIRCRRRLCSRAPTTTGSCSRESLRCFLCAA